MRSIARTLTTTWIGLALFLPSSSWSSQIAKDPARIANCPSESVGESMPSMPAGLIFQTNDLAPERRTEILTTLPGVEIDPERRVSAPWPSTTVDPETGLCLKVWESSYGSITEEYNTRPKSGDTWLATVTTKAFGQTFTVTREREPGGGDRVTDNYGGSRLESHDEHGRVTHVEDSHGEILSVRYYPRGLRPWIRIDGHLWLKTIYPKDRLSDWQELHLIGIADHRVYAAWYQSTPPTLPAARLGFPSTVARWDELNPTGSMVVKYHRDEPYAYSPIDGEGEIWRTVYLPFQSTRISYTDKEIRLTTRGETVTWRRGELPR